MASRGSLERTPRIFRSKDAAARSRRQGFRPGGLPPRGGGGVKQPYQTPARHWKKSWQKAGDLLKVRRKLWGAILWAEDTMEATEDLEIRLKAIHALVQAVGGYLKLHE